MTPPVSQPRISLRNGLLARLPTENARLVRVSPDGTQVLYTPDTTEYERVDVVRAWRLAQDNRVVMDFDAFFEPEFSPDGRLIEYQKLDLDGKVSRVVNGEEDEKFDEIGDARYSADNLHLAYHARRGKQSYVVVDRRPLPIPGEAWYHPILSPDGSRLGIDIRCEGGYCAFIDGCAGPVFSSGVDDIQFSPDGRHVAYVGLGRCEGEHAPYSGKHTVVVDGRPFGPYNECTDVLFSEGGESWVCGAKRGRRWVLLRDGEEIPMKRRIAGLCYLAGDNLFAWLAPVSPPGGNEYAGWESTFLSGPRLGEHIEFHLCDQFSPDGRSICCRRYAYDLVHIVRDGQPGPLFSYVEHPTWSPDSFLLAYEAYPQEDYYLDDELMHQGSRVVMANDWRSEKYEEIVSLVCAIDRRTVAFAVRRGREIWWEVCRTG